MSLLLHLNLSDSRHPKLGTLGSRRDSFLLCSDSVMPLSQDDLIPHPQGFDLPQEALVQPPHLMGLPRTQYSASSIACAFEDNLKMGAKWVLAPALIMGGQGGGAGREGGLRRASPLLARLFEACVLSRV